MLIIGNWKMHGDRRRLADVAAIDRRMRAGGAAQVALCLPATLIAAARGSVEAIAIGAQDCHERDDGAFTGRLSAPMLADAGAQLVVIGHSECRAAGDGNDVVRDKVAAAVRAGLPPVICVGETAGERDAGQAEEVVVAQLLAALPAGAVAGLAIAYEPVWAIGTGRVPGAGDVVAMVTALRICLAECYGAAADRVPVLYGGSVTAANAAALMALEGIGGLLVGGASLSAASFLPIIDAAG